MFYHYDFSRFICPKFRLFKIIAELRMLDKKVKSVHFLDNGNIIFCVWKTKGVKIIEYHVSHIRLIKGGILSILGFLSLIFIAKLRTYLFNRCK